LGYLSGVLAFLSFLYGFNRKAKRISDEKCLPLKSSGPVFFRRIVIEEKVLVGRSESMQETVSPRLQGLQQEVAWQGCVATLDIPRREEKDEEDPTNSHHAMYSVTYTIRIFPSLKPTQTLIKTSLRIIQ
jgi:hypothetical protein